MTEMSNPVARLTDPETSWEAADSVKLTTAQLGKAELLNALYRNPEPMTDEELTEFITSRIRTSESGLRTRRHERTRGVVSDEDAWFEHAGHKTNKTGRRCRTWRLTPMGREVFERIQAGDNAPLTERTPR